MLLQERLLDTQEVTISGSVKPHQRLIRAVLVTSTGRRLQLRIYPQTDCGAPPV